MKGKIVKVVHLSTTDFGGAYKAVERIQGCMRLYGIQSEILVRSRFFETKTTEVIKTPFQKFCSKTRNFFNLLFSHGEVVTDLFGINLKCNPTIQGADVIVLHWVNSFISAKSVRQLASLGKPILWVMHDMWPFTGGCHYDLYCERYKEGCGQCPMLKRQRKKDITSFNLHNKKELYCSENVAFVAISKWEQACALASLPLKEKQIYWISNPLDTEIFSPVRATQDMKVQYGISQEKQIILFGADKATENTTKGFKYLVGALKQLDGTKYSAVCFGRAPEKDRIQLPNIEIIYLGSIVDESVLAKWYSIADVFVAPSIQEAFGYTVCEALACGTPVVAFAIGGMLDQIVHCENGYLAELYNVEELKQGIEYSASHTESLGRRARELVLERNSYEVIGKKYKEVLERVVEYR